MAALEYLTDVGTEEDYRIVKKEYDKSDSGTSRKALECMIGILLRTGQENAAQQLVLESSFESLDTNMLTAVLNGCVFQPMPITDSGASRSPIPADADH